MRCLVLTLLLSSFLGMHLVGCTAVKERAMRQEPSPREVAALQEAHRARVEQQLAAEFGLPDWLKAMPRKPEPEPAKPVPPPAVASVPAPVIPSIIPASSVLVVGDSFAVGVGMSMGQELKGMGVALQARGKVSSGLNSPKFYNWERELQNFIQQDNPDVIVAMISGNDAHNGSGSEPWRQSYVEKARSFAKVALSAGVPLYMVGLPPMGKDGYSDRAKALNHSLEAACNVLPGCHYVDAWDLFSSGDGHFTRTKRFGEKDLTLRAKDGVHFTMTGYRLLSRHILDKIAKTYRP
jgi:uncharacterized protein